MQASIASYATYHDLLKTESTLKTTYSKGAELYAAFDAGLSVGADVPAYLLEDSNPQKAPGYATWEPSEQTNADNHAIPASTYAAPNLLAANSVGSAYSKPDDPSATQVVKIGELSVTAATNASTPTMRKERPKAQYRDWNEEFQALLEARDKLTGDLAEATPNTLALQKLVRSLIIWNHNYWRDIHAMRTNDLIPIPQVSEFTGEAQAIANAIITELNLPSEKKTIKPVDAGGIAGGIKFLVNDIFFKVACDEVGIYGDEQYAQKAAMLEFAGLLSLLEIRLSHKYTFSLPLMCVLSMRGCTLTASSVLPIASGGTLIYGSRDAGVTVMASEPAVNEMMKEIGGVLNLKPHWVGLSTEQQKQLCMPCDIEVHRGLDGRVYILDTARLFPAAGLDKRHRAGHLYRLLRGEFVGSYPSPLSSDAFSRMAKHSSAADNNREVKAAAALLHEQGLPDMATRILRKLDVKRFTVSSAARLTMLIHQHGVNIRLLGALRRATQDASLRSFLLHEMVCRVLKNSYFARLRRERPREERDVRRATAACLNDVFAQDDAGVALWKEHLIPRLQTDFEYVKVRALSVTLSRLLPIEEDHEAIVKQIDLEAVFSRFQSLISATVTYPSTVPDFTAYAKCRPFREADVQGIEMRVKFMYMFALWEAYALVKDAEKKEGDEAAALRLKAAVKYRSSLTLFPGDGHAFTSYGLALSLVADVALTKEDPKAARELFALACDQFESALYGRNHSPYLALRFWSLSLKNIAQMLPPSEEKWKLFEESEEKASLSVTSVRKNLAKLHPSELLHALDNHALTLFRQAEHLCKAGRINDAQPVWQRAHEKFEEAMAAYPASAGAAATNAAMAYETHAQHGRSVEEKELLYKKAEEYFAKGTPETIESELELSGHYYIWGCFYVHRQGPPGPGMLPLLNSAIEKFKLSIQYRPVFYKAWYGWARALKAQALYAPPADRPNILNEALAKIREALNVFPSFGMGKLLEGETLLELCEALPSEDNGQRLRRALGLGDELSRLMPTERDVWHVIATAAFRLSEATQDTAMLRRAAVAYRKEVQYIFGLQPNFTWKDALLSGDLNVRSAAVQVLLRITTNPEEQLSATAEGCIDAMVADVAYYFETPSVRVGAANIVFNCTVNAAARVSLQQKDDLGQALIRGLMHVKQAPLREVPFATALLPPGTPENEDKRIAIVDQIFGDFALAADRRAPQQVEHMCYVLKHLASSTSPLKYPLKLTHEDGHQDAVLNSQYLSPLYSVWFVNNGSVVIDWGVGPVVRKTKEYFELVADGIIATLAQPRSGPAIVEISLMLCDALLQDDTLDGNVEFMVKTGASAIVAAVVLKPKSALSLLAGLVRKGLCLSELRAAGADIALLMLSETNRPDSENAKAALQTLLKATETDQGRELAAREVLAALERDSCTFVPPGFHVKQYYHSCITCKFEAGVCACMGCVKSCHAGHELGPMQWGAAYCDCPDVMKDKCCAPKKT